jgi:hypothetical protein
MNKYSWFTKKSKSNKLLKYACGPEVLWDSIIPRHILGNRNSLTSIP